MLIAQISDLHVRPEGALYQGLVDSNAMLDAAIAHLNALDPAPDLVLVTGDLVDRGEAAEYAALRARLARLALPWHAIPGNHDARAPLRRAFPERVWPDGDEAPLHLAIEDHPVRILALDSTVPGAHHGVLDDAALAWLDATLSADRARPAIVALHHPPFSCGIPYLDRYGCRAPERLAAVIARHPQVERVLCGHVHRPIQLRWAGTLVCACPSTTTQIALRLRPDAAPASWLEPPACLLHWWRPGIGMLTHTSYIGSFPGPFPFA